MSRKHAGTVVVLNVHDDSSKCAVNSAIDRYLRRKMVFNKKDEIGFVTFGRQTRNDLADAAYYRFVAIKQPLRTADVNMLRFSQTLFEDAPEAGAHADFFEGVVVAYDLLTKHIGKKTSFLPIEILLITSSSSVVCNDYSQLNPVAAHLAETGYTVNVVVTDGPAPAVPASSSLKMEPFDEGIGEGQVTPSRAWEWMARFTGGSVVTLDDWAASLMWPATMKVGAVAKFKGELTAHSGAGLKIGVVVYARTQVAKWPAMKKLSLVSKEQTVNGFMNVKIDRQYAAVDDRSSSMSLGDPRLLKSYSYGDVLVPVGKMLEKSSFYTAKTLVIIGFARLSALRPEFLMGTCDVVYGSDARHATALAALVAGARAEKRVGIARYVPRENGRVVMVALWPHEEQGVDVFLMSPLPFKDDMREFCFRPLTDQGLQPQQKDAAHALLSAFRAPGAADSACGGDSKRLLRVRPWDVVNPNLNRFYETCCLKIDKEQVELQPPHSAHARLFEVQASPEVAASCRTFAAAFSLHESMNSAAAAKKQKRTVALSSISLADLAGAMFTLIFIETCTFHLLDTLAGKDLAALSGAGADGDVIAGVDRSVLPLQVAVANPAMSCFCFRRAASQREECWY